MIPVGHFMRVWLRRTETFIHGQITRQTRHEPVVFAREPLPESPGFADVRVRFAAQNLQDGVRARWNEFRYRRLRHLCAAERDWYVRTMRGAGCRLLHAHFATDARYVLPAVRQVKIPLITSVYGYDYSRFLNQYGGLGRWYLRPLLTLGDHFIVPSGSIRDAIAETGCPLDRITVLSWGVDTGRFTPRAEPLPEKPCIFVMVSGFTKKKGVGTLIEAFDRVRHQHADVRLVLAGTGPELRNAQARVSELVLDRLVEFPGFVPQENLPGFLRRCHVFVHPSETPPGGDKEGIPTAIMEALACGLPVVSTHHAGIPEIITDGSNGFLVGERDVEALAARMSDLATNAHQRNAFGDAGRARVVDDYNVGTQTGRLEDLYDEVLERAAKDRA